MLVFAHCIRRLNSHQQYVHENVEFLRPWINGSPVSPGPWMFGGGGGSCRA